MATPRTRITGTAQPSAPTDAELGSVAQRDRRKRILDATLALASKGGYDAVQMRIVAERAGVALGTLYMYYTSNVPLEVSVRAGVAYRPEEVVDGTPIT